MDDLAELVPSLRNVVARPGTFTTFFPETTEEDLIQVLVDGFAEAHMERLLLDHDADEDGVVIPAISRGQGALVTLFAGAQLARAELFNRVTSRSYKASNASIEEIQATNILRDILRDLNQQKARLIEDADRVGADAAFYMADQYVANVRGVEGW